MVLAFAVATAWLLDRAARPDPLPVGSTLPALGFQAVDGATVLAAGERDRTIVVWFHTRCPHCVDELDALERDLGLFEDARLHLLTSEDSLFSTPLRARWPSLAASPAVVWGVVDAERFRTAFGTTITPALFVFGPQGTLIDKYVGMVAPRVLAGPGPSSPVRDGIGPAPGSVGEPRDRTACAHPDVSRCTDDLNGRDDDA